ncbi:MAG: hypothetical protein LBV38_07810 [Alistipes sp.]|jgi:mRNA interferase RelE/StbE|nr:hypothetical protein [Alistipes sp.]
MQVNFSRDFLKRLRELRDDALRRKLSDVVEVVEMASSLNDIPNLKKLKGHRTAYRIRVGNVRIGLYVENQTALFAIFEHRKDIYNRFP